MEYLKFTNKNQQLIEEGKKKCTSRNKPSLDPRIKIQYIRPLWYVAENLYKDEGYDSPSDFIRVWKSLHRGHYKPEKEVFVYYGNFREANK